MNNKSRKTLHLVAGIYLLYLAFQLLSEVGKNGNPAVSIIGGIAFVIAGGYLIFSFIRALKIEFEEIYEEPSEDSKEDTTCE